ncbi:MAG: sugar phosphate isomerase/epimerase [Clostridia bacterium]|nr:sugar phosphate isomerase/epimerase [Clostridia bacterium]
MELSINFLGFVKRLGIENAAKLAKAAGFTACDMFISLDEAASPLLRDDYRDVAAELRKGMEAEGLKCNQTHAPFRYSTKRWEAPEHFDEFVKTLEISAILGAKVCVVHPLHYMEYLGHEEEVFALNMDYYRRLIPYAKEYGVKIGVENMWRRHPIRRNISFDTCSTAEEFVRYVDTLDSEYAVACLDLGHIVLPDGPHSPAEFIRILGHDRLQSLHVHDNDYTNDQHLLPYQGKLDWASITKALGEIDYTGDFTFEIGEQVIAVPNELLGDVLNYAGIIGKHLIAKIDENRK